VDFHHHGLIMTKATYLLITAQLLLLSGLPACRDVRGDAAVERGNVLVVGAESTDHDIMIRYLEGRSLLFLTMLQLAEYGEVTGALARAWTHSPDGLDWTFHLRSDVRWHDGTPVTARDVAFTFELLSDTAVAEAPPSRFAFVRAADDSTIILRAAKPLSPEDWTWDIALPEHRLRDLDRRGFRDWDYWKAPLGNGPFRFVRAQQYTMVELEANENHYAGRPAVDRVILKLVAKAGLPELLAGNVDLLHFVSATDALRIARDDRFRLHYWFNQSVTQAILWRHDHPLFGSPEVRRALTLGIDRGALLRVLSLPDQTPVPDGLYTARQFRGGELPPPLPYDTAEAARLLRAAGWRDTDGDGVLDREGRPFRFTLLLPGDLYGGSQAAVFVQDQLRRLGIVAEVVPIQRQLGAGRLRNGDFEAALTWMAMDDRLRSFVGEDNRVRYDNSRMTELLEQALTTPDADAQDLLYRRMTEIYRADMPVTPLFPLPMIAAAHRRVGGISSPFRLDATGQYLRIDELWLDDGSREQEQQ
jgi:peptide/nickel transport system substrate-binding protein